MNMTLTHNADVMHREDGSHDGVGDGKRGDLLPAFAIVKHKLPRLCAIVRETQYLAIA